MFIAGNSLILSVRIGEDLHETPDQREKSVRLKETSLVVSARVPTVSVACGKSDL